MQGTAATQADDYILYNRNTGALFYDADGNGSIAALQFATLDRPPNNFGAGDFVIV